MFIECERMHIDTADNVTMASEATFAACPISSLGLVFVLAYRTLATCASFRASRALDASLCRFLGEVVDVLAIFPQGHPLVMVTPPVLVAHTMRITNKEGANVVFLAEGDDFASSFVAHITDSALCSSALLVLGPLQSTPSARALLATRLSLPDFSQHLGSLSFERANAATCDDHRLTRVGGNSGQVDFTQVDGCMNLSWCFLSFWHFDAHMQLEAVVPDQAACAAMLRQVEMQGDRLAPIAHGQNNASRLLLDGLSRPFDRIVAFFAPRIFHLHLRVCLTELACSIDISKESMYYHLHRLRMQRELSAFGSLLKCTLSRPRQMFSASLFVRFDAKVPALEASICASRKAANNLLFGCNR